MSEWISVEDRLPESGNVLISCEEGYILVGSYDKHHDTGAWRIGDDEVSWEFDYAYDATVTHWMPLPCPPEQ